METKKSFGCARGVSLVFVLAYLAFFLITSVSFAAQGIIIGHTCTELSRIPNRWIVQAKENLHMVYQHTSHGSQLITGMNALRSFPDFGNTYDWDDAGARPGALDLDDYGIPAGIPDSEDLSQGDWIDGNGVTPWVTATRNLLDNQANHHVNVVVWSWCSINNHNIERYLENMEILIGEYGPGGSNPRAAAHPVMFIFMTGHAEGQGEGGFIHTANESIRAHCRTNHRILFDFADIENYNPDGNYFYDRPMWGDLDYSNVAHRDSNWAEEWIAANTGAELEQLTTGNGVPEYSGCSGCAHSESPSEANLNCVLKARAFWWMMARLAEWNGRPPSLPLSLLLF